MHGGEGGGDIKLKKYKIYCIGSYDMINEILSKIFFDFMVQSLILSDIWNISTFSTPFERIRDQIKNKFKNTI